jgi:hypothetical protein
MLSHEKFFFFISYTRLYVIYALKEISALKAYYKPLYNTGNAVIGSDY